MKSTYAWVLGGVGGGLFGYLLAVRPHGDVWLGSMLAIVSALAIFGVLKFPEHHSKPPLSSGNPWLYIISILGPVVMLIPPMGPVLEGHTNLAVIAYFGALWIGGISAGIALERRLRTVE
jgi:hypothetical protein